MCTLGYYQTQIQIPTAVYMCLFCLYGGAFMKGLFDSDGFNFLQWLLWVNTMLKFEKPLLVWVNDVLRYGNKNSTCWCIFFTGTDAFETYENTVIFTCKENYYCILFTGTDAFQTYKTIVIFRCKEIVKVAETQPSIENLIFALVCNFMVYICLEAVEQVIDNCKVQSSCVFGTVLNRTIEQCSNPEPMAPPQSTPGFHRPW